MVTLQAYQQQQHQRRSSSPQRRNKGAEDDAVVANGQIYNRQIPNNVESNETNDNHRTSAIFFERTITNGDANDLETDDKTNEGHVKRVGECDEISDAVASATLDKRAGNNNEEFAGVSCNGGYRECVEVENEDEAEVVEEELEEEEEEEEDGEDYEVEEIDVDSDDEDCGDRNEIDDGNGKIKTNGWIKKEVLTTRVQQQTSFGESDGQFEVVPHLDEISFGKVCITNSKHVHVGNTNFYKGPVTIKQFVYTNSYPVLDKEDVERNSNASAFETNCNGAPKSNGVPSGPILAPERRCDKVTKYLRTWQFVALSCFLALGLVTIVVALSIPSDRKGDESSSTTDSPDSGGDDDVMPSGSFRIIERQYWNAQPPAKKWEKLTESPAPFVIISHTATEPCFTQSSCVLRVRLIQTYHMESFGWDDIGYNFLVGGDGLAYRGRGWGNVGAHAVGYNYRSIGISFIGTFNDQKPTKIQIRAARKLIEFGVNSTEISPSYKLLGHRQVSKTLSPGDELYKIMQEWENWSPLPRP